MQDTELRISNYKRYHIRDIDKTVREMSPEQKRRLLDEIQLRKKVNGLMELPYNVETCKRIKKLLTAESQK